MAKQKLNYNTVTPQLRKGLEMVMQAKEFKPFRLVGGTALSLQRGHRKSVDIDMFTDAAYRSIDFAAIENFLRRTYSYVDTNMVGEVALGTSYFVGDSKNECIKLDVFYCDAFIQQPLVIDGIRMATQDEIVAMKMEVISQMGRKKDFWDIHELSEDYSLAQMLHLHKMRHEYTHNKEEIIRNLTSFSKADTDFDPVCLRNKSWELIKLDIIDFANS